MGVYAPVCGCMRLCMCEYAPVYARICTCLWVYVPVYVSACACVCGCMRVYVHVYVVVCARVCVYAHMCGVSAKVPVCEGERVRERANASKRSVIPCELVCVRDAGRFVADSRGRAYNVRSRKGWRYFFVP